MVGTRGSLGPTILAFLSTLVIMYVVPLPAYALMSAIGLVEMPVMCRNWIGGYLA
jgi:hypothetical protein